MPTSTVENKWQMGFRNVSIFKVTTDGSDSAKPVYDKDPVKLCGTVEVKLTDKTSSEDLYASDGIYDTLTGALNVTGELSFYGMLSNKASEVIYGTQTDANGNLTTREDDMYPLWGISFEQQGKDLSGKSDPVENIYFRCQATAKPELDAKTKKAKPAAITNKISFKASSMNFAGDSILKTVIRKSEDPANFDGCKTTMYDPTTKSGSTAGAGK